jgi:hypothetical protein
VVFLSSIIYIVKLRAMTTVFKEEIERLATLLRNKEVVTKCDVTILRSWGWLLETKRGGLDLSIMLCLFVTFSLH